MKSLIIAIAILSMTAAPARADLIGKGAREAAEFVLKKFGLKAVQEGGEVLAGRIASSVARHGDDVIAAVRRVGPKALSLADEAGENAPRVLRLLSHHGDDAARVLSRPQGMALISRYGDDVAEVLIRHKGIAEPLLEKLGEPAVKAMGAVGTQGGRRLAMMAQGGQLAGIGRTPELLGVIARHGDKAMDFIYRHRVVLAGGAALTAFLANPEPFLDGTNRFVGTVAENAVRPTVEAVGDVAHEAAGFVRWTLTLAVIALLAGIGRAVHSGLLERPEVKRSIYAVGGKLAERVLAAFSPKGAK
jgi:hypothetical protein